MDEWSVSFLDVGQGDATDILLPCGEHILIDTGPCVGRGGGSDGNILCEWYGSRPVPTRIKYVIITHNHEDHFGGLISLVGLPNVTIEKVLLLADAPYNDVSKKHFQSLLSVLALRNIPVAVNPKIGMIHSEAGLNLCLKHPPVDLMDKPPANPNVSSMVISLEIAGVEDRALVLWCGDAKLTSVANVCGGTNPSIMVGPHHGKPQDISKGHNFARVLKEIQPQRMYLSFGRENIHQHPCRDYIAGIKVSGAFVYCSEVAKFCSPTCPESVFHGNALLGYDETPEMRQCRGSMMLKFSVNSPTGVDPYKDQFEQFVTLNVPNPHCRLKK